MLRYAALGAAAGRQTVILGFSLNEQPSVHAVTALRELAPTVAVNLRDAVSLSRFTTIVKRPAELVADVGFLLQPDHTSPAIRAARTWIEQERALGRTVLGFNIHPMLVNHTDPGAVQSLEFSSARALKTIVTDGEVSVLLLPHDRRPRFGDEEMLRRIEAGIGGACGEHVRLCSGLKRAAEVKALTERLDLVVTGRMHLAIAALGMGVPIGGLAYQGKFSGLLAHFGLDDSLLLSGSDATQPQRLEEFLIRLLEQRVRVASVVEARLPEVMELAAGNLRAMRAPASTDAPGTVEVAVST